MQSQVVKNLAVDAKLFLHSTPLLAELFRCRNFFICHQATVQLWVTLRCQEGSHEESFSHTQSYTFGKSNRTFHRCSGQLRARPRCWLGKHSRSRRRATASPDQARTELPNHPNRGRRATASADQARTELPNHPNRGRRATAPSQSTVSKAGYRLKIPSAGVRAGA